MGKIPTHVVAKEAGAKPNTVTRVTKLDVYLGEFADEQGRMGSRIFLQLPGTEHVWVLQPQISGSNVVTEPNRWLREGFNKALENINNEPESV